MLKSYVKRCGRTTTAQKNAYNNLSSQHMIPFTEEKIDFSKIFNNDDITLEIGFGSGIATAQIAESNPDKNYIGIDVHTPGIGHLLIEIEKRKLSNLKIIDHDAAEVIAKMIPPSSLNAIHIFFPDPWPKKRHRKRRLVQRPFTDILANCLKPDGYIYFVTDWEDYALHALEELSATISLKNNYAQAASSRRIESNSLRGELCCKESSPTEGRHKDFAEPQSWRPKTKFEQKGLAKGHIIRELIFIKKSGQ